MAKSSTTATSSTSAPKKTAFVQLIKNVLASKRKIADENKSQKTMIENVEHAHSGVVQSIAKLDKMDPEKRRDWLFQFDVCREHMGWDDVNDQLAAGAAGSEGTPASDDDKRDFRPAYLRQPGASAAGTVTQLDPKKRGVQEAADAAEKNLAKVGRGKPDEPAKKPDEPTKH